MAYFTKTVPLKDLFTNMLADIKSTGLWTTYEISQDLTPTHTAYIQNNYEITYSAVYSSYYAYNAFDHSKNSNEWKHSTNVNGWLIYDFGKVDTAKKVLVNHYSLEARIGTKQNIDNEAPKKWRFEGSDDKTTWNILDVQDNQTNWQYGEKRYFKFNNVTAYRYYRWYFETNNGGPYISVQQVEMSNTADTVKSEVIMSSVGTGGDKSFIQMSALNTTDQYGNAMEVGFMENFDSTTLKTTNFYKEFYYTANSATMSLNHNLTTITYYLDVNVDRIYFATILDPSASGASTNACYLGLMKRYHTEGNNFGSVLALGNRSRSSYPTVLKNKALTLYQDIWTKWINPSSSPSVWGDNVFVSPLFLEGQYEGIRGELVECFACNITNLVNEDEVLINTTRYKVFVITSGGNNSFTNNCILMKIPSA